MDVPDSLYIRYLLQLIQVATLKHHLPQIKPPFCALGDHGCKRGIVPLPQRVSPPLDQIPSPPLSLSSQS